MKFLIFLLFNFHLSCFAENLNYFELGIDYWGVQEKITPQAPLENGGSNFDWKKFKNPNNKDFFKEGEYVPPEPFMELVRNPSDQNIKEWFEYMNLKNELSKRLESRMQDYTTKNNLSKSDQEVVLKKAKELQPPPQDLKRYRFRMYFDSKCPFCEKMKSTLSYLQKLGYFVEAKQIDTEQLQNVPYAVEYASKDEVSKYKITNVPLLLIGDLKEKKVFRLTGFHSPEEILQSLK